MTDVPCAVTTKETRLLEMCDFGATGKRNASIAADYTRGGGGYNCAAARYRALVFQLGDGGKGAGAKGRGAGEFPAQCECRISIFASN